MSVCWKVGLNEILDFFQSGFLGAWCLTPLNKIEVDRGFINYKSRRKEIENKKIIISLRSKCQLTPTVILLERLEKLTYLLLRDIT